MFGLSVPRAIRAEAFGDGAFEGRRPEIVVGAGSDRLLTHRLGPAAVTLCIIAGFSAIRLITIPLVGLGVDEAYATTIARRLQLSYFDHPPLHLWLVHAAAGLLGYGQLARLPFVALFAGSSWLLFSLTRRLFGGAAGAWAVFALNLSGFFTVAAGSWILPDGPLLFCLLAAAGQLAGLLVEELAVPNQRASSLYRWLLVGAWIGLAGLAKYQAVLFAVGLAGFLAATHHGRAWLRRPGPYLAAFVAAVLITPVIVWNGENGWASFAFQGGRALPTHGLHPAAPFVALVAQAGLLLPWIFVPAVIAAYRGLRDQPTDPGRSLCLWLAMPGLVLFTLTPLWGQMALPHWAMPSWLFLFPLSGDLLARSARRRRWPAIWAVASTLACIALWALAASDARTGWIGRAWPQLFSKGDPTLETVAWTPLGEAIDRAGVLHEPGSFVVAMKWNEAGRVRPLLGDGARVVVFSDDPRGFADLRGPASRIGRDALIIVRPKDLGAGLERVSRCFAAVSPLGSSTFGRLGYPEVTLRVFAGRKLLGRCSELGGRGPAAVAQWRALDRIALPAAGVRTAAATQSPAAPLL
jgi:hypothetical protein